MLTTVHSDICRPQLARGIFVLPLRGGRVDVSRRVLLAYRSTDMGDNRINELCRCHVLIARQSIAMLQTNQMYRTGLNVQQKLTKVLGNVNPVWIRLGGGLGGLRVRMTSTI